MDPMTVSAITAGVKGAGENLKGIGSALTASADAKAQRQAYSNYLGQLMNIAQSMENKLEGRADKYDAKLTDLYNTNQGRFDTEANTPLPELEGLKQDLINQSYETAGANRRQIEAELARQGVRGGQAGIIAARNLGQTTKDLQHQLNQLTYNEALNRQNSRLSNYSQGSLIPLQSLSGAYGSSLAGANNALSQAQGNTYSNAYGAYIGNYLGSQNMNGRGFKSLLGKGASILGNSLGSAADAFGSMAGSMAK